MQKAQTYYKRKLINLGKFLYNKGYIVATDGNMSIRLNQKEILITRSGVCKGELKTGDVVKLNIENCKLENENFKVIPSTEYQMHLAIYQNRPDVNAVVHAHPVHSTIFAVTGNGNILDEKILTETEKTLGKIGYVGYYQPGSNELAEVVGKSSGKSNVMILAHHGVVVTGQNLSEARHRLERLEFLAKVTLLSKII
ncbi:MAG: class II aldolase/adducin family protein [Candidatus Latescibacteria bacterium]|nr:class II aldolase/adducin family protein [Candidatus Latescibacterota bacterium]